MKRKNESMKESHCGHREHQRDRKWENMPRDTGNSGNGVITASEGRPKLRGRRIHESEVPVIAEDYMWMTDGDEPRVEDMRGMPILVAIDESTDWMGACIVPENGGELVRDQGPRRVRRGDRAHKGIIEE